MFIRSEIENTIRPLLQPFHMSLSRVCSDQAYLNGVQKNIDSIVSIIIDLKQTEAGLNEQFKEQRLTELVLHETIGAAREKATARILSVPDWANIEAQLHGKLNRILHDREPRTNEEKMLLYLQQREIRDAYRDGHISQENLRIDLARALDRKDYIFLESWLNVPSQAICPLLDDEIKTYRNAINELVDPELAEEIRQVALVNETMDALRKTAVGFISQK